MKSKESHNLDVMHLGCCTGCGGTHIIPTQFTQPAGVAPPVSNEAIETVHEKSLRLIREFLKNEPQEVKRIIKEVEDMEFEGPTVEEYFNSVGYEDSRTPEKSYREQMGYSKELERLEDMLGERIGFLEDQVLMHTFLAWQDERNNIFDSLPKHTPEVKGYSREQMEQCWDAAREYKIKSNSWWFVNKKDDYISSLPTPSTDKL